jgi:cytoskeletal protein CcmA (bactofilin family)
MQCPDDFTLSQYADGELPEDTTGKLAAHFEVCAVCRNRAQAYEAENRLLAESLQGVDWWEPERETVRKKVPGIAWICGPAAALLGIAFILQTGLDWILNKKLPAGLDWIHPFSLSGKLNLIANGFFYFLDKGGNMMTTLINEVGTAVLSLLLLGALVAMIRRTRKMASIICLTAMLLVFVVPGHAIDVRKAGKGNSSVFIAADETIDDSLVAFADSVDVRGIVTGDLITFARRINIQGAVQGNIIAFGQNVDITGRVDGDIMGFALNIRTGGAVGKNLWAFAQNITIDKGGNLGQNATVFGTNIDVNGSIGRDLTVFAAFLDVGGTVGRDLNLRGERMTVQAPAIIGRNLNAWVRLEENVQIQPGATIQGAKNIARQPENIRPNKYLTLGFYFKQVLRLAAAFLMGLLLFWLVPGMNRAPLSDGRGLLTSAGIGFLAAVAIPAAVIILAITLIGLPIALTAFLFWLLALYLAKIVVGRYIGGLLLGSAGNTMASTTLTLIVGLVIIIAAINLPFIGGILNILLTVIGLGALVIAIYRMFKGPRETAPIREATQ